MIDTVTVLSRPAAGVLRQDPDGVPWLGQNFIDGANWDGTPMDPTGKTKQELCAFLGPNPYAVKGLRQRFYEVNPFADNENPTVAEINDWNLEVIRHFRNLFGITEPVDHDTRLYLEASWADERKYTTVWDSAYPVGQVYKASPPPIEYNVGGTRTGPCQNFTDTAGGHCGAAFFPTPADRTPYISANPYNNDFVKYPELNGYNTRRSATEGLVGLNPLGVPWSLKMGFVIRNYICNEGRGGHAGPYIGEGNDTRRWFGCSWWYTGGTLNYRGKWAG
jgi:hypothetical protein